MNAAPAFPPASARNMALLVQLRWMAVFGQLVTIWVARHLFGISLPLVQLVAVPVLLAMINLSTMVIGREREGYTYLELLGALMLDVLALAWQLYFTGGTNNPFAFLFLLQIAFLVTVGVLVDTHLLRSILVPALTLDLGRRVWWPSALDRPARSDHAGERAAAPPA